VGTSGIAQNFTSLRDFYLPIIEFMLHYFWLPPQEMPPQSLGCGASPLFFKDKPVRFQKPDRFFVSLLGLLIAVVLEFTL
jgi:hypothetical protein